MVAGVRARELTSASLGYGDEYGDGISGAVGVLVLYE
jgi:hypothetical protein